MRGTEAPFLNQSMDTIHEIIQESVSGGFWRFCGYFIMNAIYLTVPAAMVTEIVRIIRNKRKH